MKQHTKIGFFFLALVVAYISISFGVVLLFPQFNMSLSVSILMPQLIITVSGIIYLIVSKIKVSQLIPYKRIQISTFIMLILCTYLMLPLVAVINAISLLFTSSGTSGLETMMQDIPFFVRVLLIAIIPACAEEFLCRGILYNTFRKRSVFAGMLVSSFLFGCLHMNLNQFFYTFLFGMYLVLVIEATGSILAAMACHFLMNFNSMSLMYLMEKLQPSTVLQQAVQTTQIESDILIVAIGFWMLIAVVTTALGVCVYIWICKHCNRLEHIRNIFKQKSQEPIFSIPLLLAIVLCFGMMIL